MIALEHELAPGDPSAVAVGRSLVSRALAADAVVAVSPGVLDDAVLAASELVTNAVAAAQRRVCVAVELVDGHARVAVYDDGPGMPMARPRTADQPHGRGLSIVQTVAARWGRAPRTARQVGVGRVPGRVLTRLARIRSARADPQGRLRRRHPG